MLDLSYAKHIQTNISIRLSMIDAHEMVKDSTNPFLCWSQGSHSHFLRFVRMIFYRFVDGQMSEMHPCHSISYHMHLIHFFSNTFNSIAISMLLYQVGISYTVYTRKSSTIFDRTVNFMNSWYTVYPTINCIPYATMPSNNNNHH